MMQRLHAVCSRMPRQGRQAVACQTVQRSRSRHDKAPGCGRFPSVTVEWSRLIWTPTEAGATECTGPATSRTCPCFSSTSHQGYGLIAVALIAQLDAIRSLPSRCRGSTRARVRLAWRHARRGSPRPDRRRQPGGADDRHAARPPRRAVVVGRAPCRHGDPPASGALPAPDDGGAAPARARGAGAREVAGDVQPDGRHHRGRVACGSRARHLRRGAERGRRGVQPDAARLHQPGRARAAAARARARARGDGAQPHGGGRRRAGRRRRDGHAPRPRLRRRARGPSALRRRRGRQSQPDARAAGDRHARLRTALAQHHDLLPRRLRRAAARSQPGRDLRAQPAAARVLPARPNRGQRLPRHQHGR